MNDEEWDCNYCNYSFVTEAEMLFHEKNLCEKRKTRKSLISIGILILYILILWIMPKSPKVNSIQEIYDVCPFLRVRGTQEEKFIECSNDQITWRTVVVISSRSKI